MELRREADVQQLSVVKEEGCSLDQEDQALPHIKEELEEADVTKFPFTPVKSEDDEEEPQSSQLHQKHTGHVEPEAGGEDCGGPGPDRNPETGDSSEPETDDSEDWKETREPQAGLESLNNKEVPIREKPFSCSECGKIFGLKRILKEHMKIHTGEKPFSCSVCGKRFSRNGHLTQHMPVHTGEKPFGCRICHKKFSWRSNAKIHKCVGRQSSQILQTEGVREAEPPASSSDPDIQPEPETNIKTEPSSEPDDSVDVEFWKETRQHQSGFTYQRRKRVSVNDGYNSSKKASSCSDDKAEPEAKTEDHGDPDLSGPKHLKSEEVSVSDTGCNTDMKPFVGQTVAKNESLHSHMTGHMTEEKPFHCSVCNTGCSDSESLVQHMRIHTRQTQFRCSFCGAEFAWRRYLEKHLEVHTKEKFYSCRDCDQSFTWYNTLRNHKCVGRQSSPLHQTEKVREAEPPVSSSVGQMEPEDEEDCGGPGTRELHSGLNSLNIPLPDSRCSLGEKLFDCSECGKTFGLRGNLNRHMRSHTGEKPVSCAVCGKAFSVGESLKVHMRLHTGEKPFKCSVCKKSFTQNGSLQSHMRIHTGEKPFSCSVCGKRFLSYGQHKSHMRNHTGSKRFTCSICHQGFTWNDQLRNHRCIGSEPPAKTWSSQGLVRDPEGSFN